MAISLAEIQMMDREANYFAMELLMPHAWLLRDLERLKPDIADP